MRYSKLFGKTLKKAPREAEAISHKLLIRAGFIDRQVSTGIYSFLPLGWRVHKKIENIIRKEMDAIGGQEVFLPTLQPKELWDRSDRWDHMEPPLFKLKDRHKKEFALGPTHEEVITDLAARFIRSYKDLPLYLYQVQNKFRNEMRSTGGLLRVREFMMKDLYSFHTMEKDLDDYYLKVVEAYKKIFKRCGFITKVTEASSGTIGGDVSHEFMMLCPTGEDSIYFCTKCDFATSKEEKKTKCAHCGCGLKKGKAIENGHVFKLGTKYSKSMSAYFIDKDGKKKLIWMGCYGIGIGRLMATVVEAHHDKKGIIWPKSVAPFQAHLLQIGEKVGAKKFAEKIYNELLKAGVEVLYDNRDDVSAGEKFAEADLIGIPVRLVVSEETFRNKKIEWKERDKAKATKLAVGQAIKKLNA